MGTILFLIGAAFAGAFIGWGTVTVIGRWAHDEPILPLRKKKPGGEVVKVDIDFAESIRWKGEIYCKKCGSPLSRIPIQDPDATDSFNPMTGEKLSDLARFGPNGLMVCDMTAITTAVGGYRSPFGYPSDYTSRSDFREMFGEKHRPKHAMYYVDKPPLE